MLRVWLIVFLVVAAWCAPVSAQCEGGLRPSDRAELVSRRVHGLELAQHADLGFRIHVPGMARVPAETVAAYDRAHPAAFPMHRWAWASGEERVDVTIACVDRVTDEGVLRGFALAYARTTAGGVAPGVEVHVEGLSDVLQRNGAAPPVATRHRVFDDGTGRLLVLSVAVTARDPATSRRIHASALPAMRVPPGRRARDDIRTALRRSIPDVRACYELAILRRPDLAGRLVLTYEIDDAGEVRAARVSDRTFEDAEVDACLVEIARYFRFGRAAPVIVRYPFVFATTGVTL